jgi:hypothetical protein
MICNLTQHPATPDQVAAGVIDLAPDLREALCAALTFERLPTARDITERADLIAEMAALHGLPASDDDANAGADTAPRAAMIGGAPYLMAPLEAALRERGIAPLYAFSTRESVEQVQADGSVRKVNVFRHAGFVPAA